MAVTTPQLLNGRRRLALRDLSGITGFAPASDRDYDGLRAMLREAGRDVADLVPGGWQLKIRNEPPRTD